MKQENLTGYLSDLDMYNTFLDSLILIKHDNVELLQTSSEMVQFLTKKYESKELTDSANDYISSIKTKSDKLRQCALIWLDNINFCTVQSLIEIQSKDEIPTDIVELYFKYFTRTPVVSARLGTVLLNFVQKYNYILPEKAFELCMHIIKLQPSLIRNDKNLYTYSADYKQVEFTSCPVCRGTGVPHFNAYAFKMGNYKEPHLPFKLWMKCDDCNNLYTRYFAKSFIDQTLTKKLVKGEYNPDFSVGMSSQTFSQWGKIINRINEHTKLENVLEVGIGEGAFIATALEMLIPIDAVEIDEQSATKIANLLNVDIHCMDFLNYETDKKYSALFMGDVIEHIVDPKRALTKAYNLLKDDGVLWISTPNLNSAFSRFYKYLDPMWCESTHISYFSYETFSKMINECGFKVLEYTVSARYNGSMELILSKI